MCVENNIFEKQTGNDELWSTICVETTRSWPSHTSIL